MMYRPFPPPLGVPHPLQFLGAPVSIKLVNGEVVSGDVFCYDLTGSKTVVLREQKNQTNGGSATPCASFRIIEFQHVHEVTGLGPPPPTVDAWLPPCDPRILEQRERAALNAFEATKHTIGVGVTREAQEIFNFIHKTHPDCRWTRDRRISVMGVFVNPPYGADDCEGTGRALDRIKQVIQCYCQRRETDKQRVIPAINNQQPTQLNHPLSSAVPMEQGFLEMVGTAAPVDYQYVKIASNGFPGACGSSSPMANQPNPSGVYMMVVHPGAEEGGMLAQRGGQPLVMAPTTEHSGPFFTPFFFQGQPGAPPSAPPQQVTGPDVNGATIASSEGPESDTLAADSNQQGDAASERRLASEAPPIREPEQEQQRQQPHYSASSTPVGIGASPALSPGQSPMRPFTSANSFTRSDSTPTAPPPPHHGGKNPRSNYQRRGNRNRRDG